MTVAELIELLKTLPQGHLVVYQSCSDMCVLDKKDLRVTRGVRHHNLEDVVRDYHHKEQMAVLERLLSLRQEEITKFNYGPYEVIVPVSMDVLLDSDYAVRNPSMTLRQRILCIESFVRTVQGDELGVRNITKERT